MGTRSRIGIQLKDGSILSSYHHWDGYPEWLGRILTTHYNSCEQAAELIDGGDMSCAWTKDRWTGKQLAAYVTEQKEAEEYGPQYYLDAVKIALLVLMTTLRNTLLMVKNMVTSLKMVNGSVMILKTGPIHIRSRFPFLKEHWQYD